jgi:hypothetical protein
VKKRWKAPEPMRTFTLRLLVSAIVVFPRTRTTVETSADSGILLLLLADLVNDIRAPDVNRLTWQTFWPQKLFLRAASCTTLLYLLLSCCKRSFSAASLALGLNSRLYTYTTRVLLN